MKICFGFMFWGLLLVALDFRINSFDLLPDTLGYALVAIGAGGLASMTSDFAMAGSASWMLAVGSLIGPFIAGNSESTFSVLMAVLNCTMMWTLLGGTAELAAGRSKLDIAGCVKPLRAAYIAVIAISTVLSLTHPGSAGVLKLVVVVLVVAVLVVMALILHLIYQAWTELSS